MEVALRRVAADDLAHLKWALYQAVSWNPERQLPPFEVTIEHPELARYHRDWGRPGDVGVIATRGDDVVGVAFCRLFSQDDHGHGFVDDETPELAVAVASGHRDAGIGTRLMDELASVARAAGFRRLSLSVDAGNPAVRLYRRLGYRELSRDEGGIRMIRDL